MPFLSACSLAAALSQREWKPRAPEERFKIKCSAQAREFRPSPEQRRDFSALRIKSRDFRCRPGSASLTWRSSRSRPHSNMAQTATAHVLPPICLWARLHHADFHLHTHTHTHTHTIKYHTTPNREQKKYIRRRNLRGKSDRVFVCVHSQKGHEA